MSDAQRRVLMITYAFPPAAYVGVHRTLKYCKYLPANGWMPVVLTIDARRVAHQDAALCRQIPGDVIVHRTRDVDPAKWLDARARPAAAAAAAAANGTQGAPPPARATWLARTKRLLRQLLTQCPDSHLFWVPFALARGARILLKERIEIIYSSAPPHSTDIVAYLLGRAFGRPYVLDYRDPWTIPDGPRVPGDVPRWIRALERRVRSVVIRNAARVIAISPGERDELRTTFADVPPERFTYITNGYDPCDFHGLPRAASRPGSRMTLTHAGTVYPGAADEFFGALELLASRATGVESALEVVLIGEVADQYATTVSNLQKMGLLRAMGPQPHAVAVQHVLDSDALLILLGGDSFPPSEIPAKTFEYLYAGKPILAIAPEGDLSGILRASGLGTAVPPGNAAAVATAIDVLLAEHAAGSLARVANEACVRRFDRAALSGTLAGFFDAVAEGRP